MGYGTLTKHYRPKKWLWEFNGDGRFPTERIKGKDKHYLKVKRRLMEKKFEFDSP